MKNTFYITTAIDYPNGSPHMGHAYEKIVSDFYARYFRLKGRDTYFLTGTDENGQKLRTAALEAKMETREYVDKHVESFKQLCFDLNISYDDFIRTTEKRHREFVHDMWNNLQENGLIYKGEYTGHYCEGCENFYTESQLEEGNKCPHHQRELSLKTEKGYFFKLGHFQDWITAFIEKNPSFIVPGGSRKEILSRLKREPLRDLSISRPNQNWGITVPCDDSFVIYTWFDALINYYSALDETKQHYWPASCHVIGRDIIWFHCVIWPCILHALSKELPKTIYVHGMVLAEDGKKMSKALGNGIDPKEILRKYDLDTFRFYMLRNLSAHANGRFSESAIIELHNNALANDYGNLVLRVVKMTMKDVGEEITLDHTFKSPFDFQALNDSLSPLIANFEHDKALGLIWTQLQGVNQYLNEKQPWKIRANPKKLKETLLGPLHAIHALSYLLSPAMPKTAIKVLKILGVNLRINPFTHTEKLTYRLREPEILFKKIDL